jgi:ketosteroid isomerase-like protein
LSDSQIAALEERRWAALIASDVTTLRAMYSPDLAYTHSNGQNDTRDTYLEPIASGRVRYTAVRRSDEQIRRHGDTAVITGRADMVVEAGGKQLRPAMRYSAVWTRNAGDWQLVCWHATGITG